MCILDGKQALPAWNAFAKQLGLVPYLETGFFANFFSIDNKVQGRYRNHDIILKGDNYYYYNRERYEMRSISSLSVNISNPKNVSMSICPKSFEFFSMPSHEDMKTGNYQFDKLFKIQGNEKREIQKILDSWIQTKILNLHKPKKFYMGIDGKIAHVSENGLIKDVDTLISITDILIDIVEKLEDS